MTYLPAASSTDRAASPLSLGSVGRGRSKSMRLPVSLVCTECKSRNYKTTKRREQRLEIKKFCKRCGRHTIHHETK